MGATVFARGHHDTLGGTSAGKALNLVALGVDVVLWTTLGTDAPGDLARAALQRDGLTVHRQAGACLRSPGLAPVP